MKSSLLAFSAGLLFSIGLVLGGMTQPERIIGFLDFFGNWDPTLALVMLGAVGVNVFLFRWILKRPNPLWAPRFYLPTRNDISFRLVAGAALFGVGWGLGGFCPAPSLVVLPAFGSGAWVFVVFMLAGIWLHDRRAQD